MLRNLNDLKGCSIRATDGDIGSVTDFYIDDDAWVIRYLVVETGNWLSSRKVLISPISIDQSDWRGKKLAVSITREQVKNSPGIDTDKPVSRQHEIDYLGYYGYPLYWSGPSLWGTNGQPTRIMPQFVSTPSVVQPQVDNMLADGASAIRQHMNDPHLRSCNTMLTYHVHAIDGEIGHVKDLLVDEQTWAIRYLIVNTSNWWLGHQVLIAPDWIDDMSWSDGVISLGFTRQKVQDAPPHDPAINVERIHEANIYKHYGNMAYWVKEQAQDASRGPASRQ